MAEQAKNDGSMPLKEIPKGLPITKAYPWLSGKAGLFAWTNPATGMGYSDYKFYSHSDPETGEPARLLALVPSKDAKVVLLVSQFVVTTAEEQRKTGQPTLTLPDAGHPSLEGVDLVKHIQYDRDGTRMFQEWIVLNPRKVVSFSASPKALAPILNAELIRLEDPRFRYPENQIHSSSLSVNDPSIRSKFLIPFLKADLQAGEKGIPAIFVGELTGYHSAAAKCELKIMVAPTSKK